MCLKQLKHFILLVIFTSSLQVSINAEISATSTTPSIATLMNPDGTLNLTTGFTGSLNLNGFQVELDECNGVLVSVEEHSKKVIDPTTGKWSTLNSGPTSSGGLNGRCYAIAVSGNKVYVGGDFTTAGTVTVNNIAVWDGSSWGNLQGGLQNGTFLQSTQVACHAIAIAETGDVYVGGRFEKAGTINAEGVAIWNGVSWSTLGTDATTGKLERMGVTLRCNAIAISGSDVYVGGFFKVILPQGKSTYHIAKWDGLKWSPLGDGLDHTCMTLAITGNDIYAGGQFKKSGNTDILHVGRWSNQKWSQVGDGFDKPCHSITISGNDIYAGGAFTKSGTTLLNSVAKLKKDGPRPEKWGALGEGLSGFPSNLCHAIVASGNVVIAAGYFNKSGTTAVNSIALWKGDGTWDDTNQRWGGTWEALGQGLNNYTDAVSLAGTDVYAGGFFRNAGGNSEADYIAKYTLASDPVGLDFDGVDDNIVGFNPSLPQGNAARTVEAWCRLAKGSGGLGVIFNYGDARINNHRFSLMLRDKKLYFAGQLNDLSTSDVLEEERWYHVAVTFDGTTVSLYIDGVSKASRNMQTNPQGNYKNLETTGHSFNIGCRLLSHRTEQFKGRIDEIRVWNKVRNPQQLLDSKDCKWSDSDRDGLVAYYNFQDGAAGANNSGEFKLLNKAKGNIHDGDLKYFRLNGSTSNYVVGKCQ